MTATEVRGLSEAGQSALICIFLGLAGGERMSQRYTLRDSRRMATCPACWAMGTKELKYFVLGRLEQPRQNINLLYPHDKPNEPNKKEPLSFVPSESPFASVSTVSSGHPSLASLVTSYQALQLPLSPPLLSGPDLEKYEGKQPMHICHVLLW